MLKRAFAVGLLVAACGKSESPPSEGSGGSGAAVPPAAGSGAGSSAAGGDTHGGGLRKRVEAIRTKLDTNTDGKLTVDELKAATGRMKFDDPAALDTDRDGDISADELEVAMKARRSRWKRDGGSAGLPSDDAP